MKNTKQPISGQPDYFLKFRVLHFLFTSLFLFQSFILSAQEEEVPCPPPAECGNNAQYFCGEITGYNWIMAPDGAGNYTITMVSFVGGASITFSLYSGSTLVSTATLSGNTAYFYNVVPGCYRLYICATNEAQESYYCCTDLPCTTAQEGCCELKYSFYTNFPSPQWRFGDGEGSSSQTVVHEYTNVNTYASGGVPSVAVSLIVGSLTFPTTITFPAGIWVGKDCFDSGNAGTLANSLNTALSVFPVLSYSNKNISIKGSITMDQNYQFTGCDFCMNPSARIVANTNTLSFLTNTVLHDATCKSAAWYGVELRSGRIVGDEATFRGAYNAIYAPVAHTATANLSLMNCVFVRNYLGIRLNRTVAFSSTFGNTFGNSGSMQAWPGLNASCTSAWVSPIGKPQNADPFAGIYAETPASSAAVNLVFPNNLSNAVNSFYNLSNGIYLANANGMVRQSRFVNMLSGAYAGDDGYGIHLYATQARQLQQWGLGKTNSTLTFDNCRHAIHVEMPQFTATGSVFLRVFNNNMEVEHGCTVIGGFARIRPVSLILDNQIEYAGEHGILVENPSVNSRISIRQNHITGVTAPGDFGAGVFLNHYIPIALGTSDVAIVKDNDTGHGGGIFGGSRGVSIGVFPNTWVESNLVEDFSESGIGNSASFGNRIRCNDVNSTAGNTDAIFLFMAPNTTVSYNHTDDTDQGLKIAGGSSTNSLLLCNEIGSHEYGLFFDALGESGPQLPDMSSAGNTWTGTYGTNAAYMPFGGLAANSRFYYRTGEINPLEISGPGSWFIPVSKGVTCGEGCPSNEPTALESPTDRDLEIANGGPQDSTLEAYLSTKYLYTKLLRTPSLVSAAAALLSFRNACAVTAGGRLLRAEKTLAEGYNLTAPQQIQWDLALSDLETAFAQWAVLDSLVETGTGIATQAAARTTLTSQIAAADSVLLAVYQSNLAARVALAPGIQLALDSITAVELYEVNEKDFNQIFLNTVFVDVNPSPTELLQIEAIGEQCSTDGGPIVFSARNWYHTLTSARIVGDCGGVDERNDPGSAAAEPSAPVRLSVSPNPAGDRAFVSVKGALPAGASIGIFDVTGKLRKMMKIPAQSNAIDLETAGLANGMYVCRLVDARGGLITTVRFNIQH